MFVRFAHASKASFSIFVILSGIVMVTISLYDDPSSIYPKTEEPIPVTVFPSTSLGITTSKSCPIYSKSVTLFPEILYHHSSLLS